MINAWLIVVGICFGMMVLSVFVKMMAHALALAVVVGLAIVVFAAARKYPA